MDLVGFFNTVTGDNLLFWKVVATTVVFALAGLEVFMAARFWGVSETPRISVGAAAKIHRINGRFTLPLAVLVAITCLVGPAGPTTPARVLFHSIFGTALFAVLAAKFLILRVLHKGDRWLPHLGSSLFLLFAGLWGTSVFQYVTGG
ncbi:MAG: DUF6529 family protein [Egibacteraceae bacterium]